MAPPAPGAVAAGAAANGGGPRPPPPPPPPPPPRGGAAGAPEPREHGDGQFLRNSHNEATEHRAVGGPEPPDDHRGEHEQEDVESQGRSDVRRNPEEHAGDRREGASAR